MELIGKIFLLCLVALATDAKKTRLSILAKEARPGEFPYQVGIYMNGELNCGGALISTRHVLTAGHCVKPILEHPEVEVLVGVGSVNKRSGQRHRVARAAPHPHYGVGSSFIPNDIGVLTLQTPVTESSTVKVIALPSAGTVVPDGAEVVISGFGKRVRQGQTSETLQKDTFRVVSQNECNYFYLKNFGTAITSSHICAKRGKDHGTCNGDSGGPLVYNNQVVGVVSGGDGTCNAGNPDVYTKVASYLGFIKQQMAASPNSPPGPGLPPAGIPGLQPQIPGWDPLGPPVVPGQFPELPQYPPGLPQYPPGLPQYPPRFPQYPPQIIFQ